MMRPDAKVEKVYLYPNLWTFEIHRRTGCSGRSGYKGCRVQPVRFVFLNKPRNRVKILYWDPCASDPGEY